MNRAMRQPTRAHVHRWAIGAGAALMLTGLGVAGTAPSAASPTATGLPQFGNGRIAFSEASGTLDILTVDPDGSDEVNLTSDPAQQCCPDFSLDGQKITYFQSVGGTGEIFVMNADGSNRVNLTNDGEQDENPSFSGDRSKIAFASLRSGNTATSG